MSAERVYRHRPDDRRERAVLRDHIRPGSRALDVGCAATGRSSAVLADLGASVVACDIELEAVRELGADPASSEWQLAVADMRHFPFDAGRFDAVVVAFHGFDYLLTRTDRIRLAAEAARLLRPGGILLIDTYNRWSAAFHFPARPDRRTLAHRLRYLSGGGPLRPVFTDMNGLRLRHDTSTQVRRIVESQSELRFEGIWDSRGRRRRWATARFTVAEPLLIFSRS